MLPPFRRLLLALALACAGLVLVQTPAQACSCKAGSVSSQAEAADVVFSGVLVAQEPGRKRTTFSLDVERIYQGRIAETPVDVVTATQRSLCGLGSLKVDRAYVVFATRGEEWLVTGQCSGTGRATPAYVGEVEGALGPGNEIPQPPAPGSEPPKPTYDRVADTDPPEFTRLAAPGGAMVLVGLLGLLLFRKRS